MAAESEKKPPVQKRKNRKRSKQLQPVATGNITVVTDEERKAASIEGKLRFKLAKQALLKGLEHMRNKQPPPSFAEFQCGKGCHFEMVSQASPDVLLPQIVGYDTVKFLKKSKCDLSKIKESLIATKLAQNEFIAERRKKELAPPTDGLRELMLSDIYEIAENCLLSVIAKPGCLDIFFGERYCRKLANYVSKRVFRWNPTMRFNQDLGRRSDYENLRKRFMALWPESMKKIMKNNMPINKDDIIDVSLENCSYFLFYYTLHALRYCLMWRINDNCVRFYERLSPLPDGMSHVDMNSIGEDYLDMASHFLSELHMSPDVTDWADPDSRSSDDFLLSRMEEPVKLTELLLGRNCYLVLQQNGLGDDVLECVEQISENHKSLPNFILQSVLKSKVPLEKLRKGINNLLECLFDDKKPKLPPIKRAHNIQILSHIVIQCIQNWKHSEPFMKTLEFGTHNPVAVPFIEHVRKCLPNYEYLKELLHALFFNIFYFQIHYVIHWLKTSTVLVEGDGKELNLLTRKIVHLVDLDQERNRGESNKENNGVTRKIKEEPNNPVIKEQIIMMQKDFGDDENILEKKIKEEKKEIDDNEDTVETMETAAYTVENIKKRKWKNVDVKKEEETPEKRKKKQKIKLEVIENVEKKGNPKKGNPKKGEGKENVRGLQIKEEVVQEAQKNKKLKRKKSSKAIEYEEKKQFETFSKECKKKRKEQGEIKDREELHSSDDEPNDLVIREQPAIMMQKDSGDDKSIYEKTKKIKEEKKEKDDNEDIATAIETVAYTVENKRKRKKLDVNVEKADKTREKGKKKQKIKPEVKDEVDRNTEKTGNSKKEKGKENANGRQIKEEVVQEAQKSKKTKWKKSSKGKEHEEKSHFGTLKECKKKRKEKQRKQIEETNNEVQVVEL